MLDQTVKEIITKETYEFYPIIITIMVMCILVTLYSMLDSLDFDYVTFRKTISHNIFKAIKQAVYNFHLWYEDSLQKKGLIASYNKFIYKLWMFSGYTNSILIFNIGFYLLTIGITAGFALYFLLMRMSLNPLYMLIIFILVLILLLILAGLSIYPKERKFVEDIIAAEIALSASISLGFTKAIKLNQANFSPELRKIYLSYLKNVEEFNYPVEEAIDRLDNQLLGKSKEFLSRVKIYEIERLPWQLQWFEQIITINRIRKEGMTLVGATTDAAKISLYISFGLTFFFFIVMLIYIPITQRFYFRTIWGIALFLLDIISVLLVVMRLNNLSLKDFVEGDV